MKKLVIGLIVFISLFGLSACNKKVEEVNVSNFKNEYESLNGKTNESGKIYPEISLENDEIIRYATIKDLENIFENKKTGAIYFGFPECPWCRNAVPVLLDSAKEAGLGKIYYMNVLNMRDKKVLNENGEVVTENKGTSDYFKILNWLDSILPDYKITDKNNNEISTNEKRLYVPIVVFVKDGEIVGYHSDTVESQNDPYELLTTKQKRELKNIYTELIHKMLDDLCDESC